MAQFKLTPHEFIQHTFSPMVAVICTPAAEEICQKNNLSFVELIQPFCKLNSEVHFKDPSGNTITIKNLRISMHDIDSRPPAPTLARKLLNESVNLSSAERSTSIQIGNSSVDIPASVPWFETWRETFLQVQFPSDHEFTKHYVACLLVASAGEESPAAALAALARQVPGHGQPSDTSGSVPMSSPAQPPEPQQLPKWMPGPPPPIAALLLLDLQRQAASAGAAPLEAVKSALPFASCALLLPLNGHSPSTPPRPARAAAAATLSGDAVPAPAPDPWAQFLPPRRSAGLSDSSQEPAAGLEAGMGGRHPLSPVPGTEEGESDVGNEADVDAEIEKGSIAGGACIRGPRGALLSPEDLEHVRSTLQELATRCLVPHAEHQLQILADTVANKKGVSRSLLSATKRWFGSNKPGSPGASAPPAALVYTGDAPELQLRRLGDLSFMFGAYTLAFQAYHSAKRDFSADGAWLHYAGALEMAALSAFMQGEATRKAQEYMEEAIMTYLNTCKLPQWAVRATLLSAECLRSRGQWGEAAQQLIRMASEDSDLRSALLLEQAAYSFLRCQKPYMGRKYAFHAVLAGHRFSKAGQRRHALRCYAQALQVYEKKSWSLAEDHIHFTIGRQAANLRLMEQAVQAFGQLLTPLSRQTAQQQAAFLREFVCIQQQQQQLLGGTATNGSAPEPPELPLPLIEEGSLRVLVGPLPPVSVQASSDSSQPSAVPVVPASGVTFMDDNPDTAKWSRLEEALITVVQKQAPMIFRPTIYMFSNRTDNSRSPVAIAGEPVSIQVHLMNPLQVALPLRDICLEWSTQPSQNADEAIPGGEAQGSPGEECGGIVEAQSLNELLLSPDTATPVCLSATPRAAGRLTLRGLRFRLALPATAPTTVTEGDVVSSAPAAAMCVSGRLPLRPPLRPSRSKGPRNEVVVDQRLNIVVQPAAPCLQVWFEGLQNTMLCGEVQHVLVHFRNIGSAPLHALYLAVSQPDFFVFETQHKGQSFAVNGVTSVPLDALAGAQLGVGQELVWGFWVRAPDTPRSTNVQLLMYYESVVAGALPKYRLVRHEWLLATVAGLKLWGSASQSSRAPSSVQNGARILNMPVQAQNLCQVQGATSVEVEVAQAAILTPGWRLCPSPVVPSMLKLLPQEKMYLLLQVQQLPKEGPNGGEMEEKNPPTVCQNSCLRLATESDSVHKELDVLPIALAQHEISAGQLLLLLQWQASVNISGPRASSRRALGQSLLRVRFSPALSAATLEQSVSSSTAVSAAPAAGDEPPGVEAAPPPPPAPPPPLPQPPAAPASAATTDSLALLEALQAQVTFSVAHPSRLRHDFARHRLCVVPVQLVLQNCSLQELLVKVNTLGASSSGGSGGGAGVGGVGGAACNGQRGQLYSPRASPAFRWVGRARAWLPLAPLARHSLPLAAALPQPGTFDLGAHLEVWCRHPDALPADAVAQRWRLESAIIVSA